MVPPAADIAGDGIVDLRGRAGKVYLHVEGKDVIFGLKFLCACHNRQSQEKNEAYDQVLLHLIECYTMQT